MLTTVLVGVVVLIGACFVAALLMAAKAAEEEAQRETIKRRVREFQRGGR